MSKAGPPGYRSAQLLPQLRWIQRDTLGFLQDCAHKFGDMVAFEAGGTKAFFINHPDGIRHILQDNAHNYTKNTLQYNALATITGRGLLTSDGPLWLSQRRLAQPAFSRPRLAALDVVVVPTTQDLLARWEASATTGAALDIDREMMQVTLEVVGKALFSIDLRREAASLTTAVLTALDYIVFRARNPLALPTFLPLPRYRRFRSALQTLDTAIYALIHQRQSDSDLRDDLLGILLRARDEETGQAMSAQQVRDELITLLIAGHETVASALTWVWYLLAQHPAERQQMYAEVSAVLGGRLPTSADLAKLPYTTAVFNETLRLYPPAWLITRQSIAADEIGGWSIPPHALIILSPYVTQRDGRFWSEPERFDPQRFLPGPGKTYPRYAYLPFGGGPRMCIGSGFAMTEAQLILAMVAQRFQLDLIPEQSLLKGGYSGPTKDTLKVDALVTLRPHNGMPMRLTHGK